MRRQHKLTFIAFSLAPKPPNRKWIALASHRAWLLREAEALFSFFERRIIIPLGGFYDLDDEGRPTVPGYGSAGEPAAASSAKVTGHPDAHRLLVDISTVIRERFWEEQFGAVAEEFTRNWQSYGSYHGQNSNMHLTESLMAAFEATNDSTCIRMAERIADLIVGRHAAANNWRIPEHFTSEWLVDRNYAGSPMLRPFGTTLGHSLEWSRLLLQLWELGDRKLNWLAQCSKALFCQAVLDGWDKPKGGFTTR